jgi:hypothetical protein
MRDRNAGTKASTNTHYWFCIGSGFLAGLLAFFICTHDFDFHWPFRMPVTITKTVMTPVTVVVNDRAERADQLYKGHKPVADRLGWMELSYKDREIARTAEIEKTFLGIGDTVNGKRFVGGKVVGRYVGGASDLWVYQVDFPGVKEIQQLYRYEISWEG